MNILVLETDPREMTVIQKAVNGDDNTETPIASSAQAWQAFESGGSHVLIDEIGRAHV